MNKLSNYTNELFIEIRNDFKKLMKSGNKNNVHHFRVNLKEIFALLEFISYCYMTEKPHFKKLHKLFKHAGEIREMQILYADLKANVKIKNKKFDTLLEEIKVNCEIEFMLFKNKYQDQGDTIFNKPEIWISYALKNKPSYNIEEYFKMEQKKMLSLMLQITIDQKQIN